MTITADHAEPATDVAVSAVGLVKRYGDLTAVDGIDFEVCRGTCLGVLGPNGAGKTTTIEILEGLKKPDGGTVRVLGRAWDDSPREIQERIGVQLQETEFQDKIKVYELLRMFRSFYHDGAALEEVIAVAGLEEKRGAFVKTLSGGQKQRLGIACALLHKPEILFLDEPTTGLDPQARRRLWEVVESFKTNGGTVVLTTHYMEEAERLADDLIIVDHGRVIARGSPSAIIASLGAESVVRFAVAEPGASEISEETLAALPGVRSVRYEGAAVVLSVVHTQATISALFALIEERGLVLEDLHTHRPTLEDVFVSLTGKHLRDE
ncbi:MAG: ABC transporter ATP-binding protein [Planctomycetes bacterium]|nr:ABC transporter ATP-binding protein [Planctomycetota bacterium]